MCGHVFGIIARMIMNNIANYIDDDKTEMFVMIATMAKAARRVWACFLEILRG